MSTQFGFKLVDVIGSGSSSTVVLARPVGEERLVILKVLHRDLAQNLDSSARSRDEARLLAQLDHPNIVTVETLTSFRGCPIVVMEHIDGVDLGTLLRHAPDGLPLAETLEIVRLVARALDAAFTASGATGRPLRVIHRDIKPSNVLLSLEGEVKVVDFNLAMAEFDGRETADEERVLGSRGYVAPEAYHGHPVLPAVDVYALGITLFELLSGRTIVLPRAADRHDAELERLLTLVAPEGISHPLAASLRNTVAAMCAYHPDRRPVASTVADTLAGLAVAAGLQPDLPGMAAARIPHLRGLQPNKTQDHQDWARVRFLDEHTPSAPPPVDPAASTSEDANPLLTRLLVRLGLRSD